MRTLSFRRLLIASVLGIALLMGLYTADIALEPKYLLLGVVVGGYITAISATISGWSMLFQAHNIVVEWLRTIFLNKNREIALLGPINCRGSTEFVLLRGNLTSNGFSVGETHKGNQKLLKSQEINKAPALILHKSGPVRPVFEGQSVLSRDQKMLKYMKEDDLFSLIVGALNSKGVPLWPQLELALSELKLRLSEEAKYTLLSANNRIIHI